MAQFSSVEYDIRQGAVFADSGATIPNPSGPFRRRHRMCRTSFSVWMCRDECLPYSLFEQWRLSTQVRFWVVPQMDSPAFRQRCRDALEMQIAEAVASVDTSLSLAAVKADASGDVDAYEKASTRIVHRMERILGDLREVARTFEQADLPFSSAQEQIQHMGATANSRLALQAALVAQLQGTSMAVAAAADEVPPQVMADFIEDQTGLDMGAVRAVFMAPAPGCDRPITGSASYTTTPPPPPVSPAETPPAPRPVLAPAQQVAYGNGHGPDRCPQCGAGLTAPKQGRRGRFRGCVRFPQCRGLRAC